MKEVEKEKGIVVRFVIGHSATKGGILDRAIDEEDAEYGDFLRLNHVEGYHQLSTKTRLYFSTAIALWDADFYVKVDDDVHLNLGSSFFVTYKSIDMGLRPLDLIFEFVLALVRYASQCPG